MKNNIHYRILSREVAKLLSNKEIYVYLVLLFKSDFHTGVSHVTQETLSKLTGYPEDTVSRYLEKVEQYKFIDIQTSQIGQTTGGRPKNKNTYYNKIPTHNFIMVQKELLDLNINGLSLKKQSEIKGFLLLIKCVCLNNGNITLYGLNKITEEISLSYVTIQKLMVKCKKLGLIIDNPNGKGYLITGDYFDIGNTKFRYPKGTPIDYKLIYEEIYYYLIGKGQREPPIYKRSFISNIATRYYSSQRFAEHPNISNMLNLMVELENRIPKITKPIKSLNYICKALLGRTVKAELQNEVDIIL